MSYFCSIGSRIHSLNELFLNELFSNELFLNVLAESIIFASHSGCKNKIMRIKGLSNPVLRYCVIMRKRIKRMNRKSIVKRYNSKDHLNSLSAGKFRGFHRRSLEIV